MLFSVVKGNVRSQSTKSFVREFELLIKIILDGPHTYRVLMKSLTSHCRYVGHSGLSLHYLKKPGAPT